MPAGVSVLWLALLLSVTPATARPQIGVPAPTWTAVLEWRSIPPRSIEGVRGFVPAAIIGRGDTLFGLLPIDRQLLIVGPHGAVDVRGRNAGFQRLSGLGFIGDTLWVSDEARMQFTLFPPRPTIGFGVRRFTELLGNMNLRADTAESRWRPVAPLEGGRLLIEINPPSDAWRDLAGLPPAPWRGTLLVGGAGPVRPETLAVLAAAHRTMALPLASDHYPSHIPNPFAYKDLYARDPFGRRVVAVQLPLPDAERPVAVVTAWDSAGGVAFRRTLPVSLRPVTSIEMREAASRYSPVGRAGAGLPGVSEFLGAITAANPPGSVHAPIDRILIGSDLSVWLHDAGSVTAGTTWIVLDSTGRVLGRLAFPTRSAGMVLAADLDHVWTLTSNGPERYAVARYRVLRSIPTRRSGNGAGVKP